MVKNWKTTVAGLITAFIPVLTAIQSMIDTDPLTNPNWDAVIAGIVVGIGLIFAKDISVGEQGK